jgi:hypothetical protein
MANNLKRTVVISTSFFGIALLGILLAFIFLFQKNESMQPAQEEASAPSPIKITAGLTIGKDSEVTLRGTYNNPESEAFALRLEEDIPGGTEYAPGSLRHNDQALTDLDDGDGGRYDEINKKVVWDLGSLIPGGSGSIEYRVKILGDRNEMESITRVIIDPDTEDEQEFLSEPLAFSLGEGLPLEDKEIIPPAPPAPEVGGEEPENFSLVRLDGRATLQGFTDLQVLTADGRLLDYDSLTLGMLQARFLARINKPLRGIFIPATALIARGGKDDTAGLRDRQGGATNSGMIKPDGSCLDLSLKYKPIDLAQKGVAPYNLFMVWYNAPKRTWEKISSNLDSEFNAVVGCVTKLGVYTIGY